MLQETPVVGVVAYAALQRFKPAGMLQETPVVGVVVATVPVPVAITVIRVTTAAAAAAEDGEEDQEGTNGNRVRWPFKNEERLQHVSIYN